MAIDPLEKAPYKATITLKSAKPEHVAEALNELRERAAEYDQTGEASATLILESFQESTLMDVINAFETWLFYHGHAECEVKLKRPGLRPETSAMLAREKKRTPMDQVEGFESVTISNRGGSATLTAGTARNAAAMLRDTPIGSDGPPRR